MDVLCENAHIQLSIHSKMWIKLVENSHGSSAFMLNDVSTY